MDELSDNYVEPKELTLLRRLSTALLVVMIFGFVALIIMFVMRLQPDKTVLPLPNSITLPDGSVAETFTQAQDWYAIVTTDGRVLIFDRASGDLRQTMEIKK